MENTSIEKLFTLVDRFRQNQSILKTLAMPECVVQVGVPGGQNLLTEFQAEYVKQDLVKVVQAEQNSTWTAMEVLLNEGSPYQ